MELLNIILGSLATIFAGLNIYQLVSFRAFKLKYQSEAEKDAAVSAQEKQSALETRLDSIEKLYEAQGKLVDELRVEIINLKKEKFASEKRIVVLEEENKTLREKQNRIEQELAGYRNSVERKKNGKA